MAIRLQRVQTSKPQYMQTNVQGDISLAGAEAAAAGKLAENIGSSIIGLMEQNQKTKEVADKALGAKRLRDFKVSKTEQAQNLILDPASEINVQNVYEKFWKPEFAKERDAISQLDLQPAAMINTLVDFDTQVGAIGITSSAEAFKTELVSDAEALQEQMKVDYYNQDQESFNTNGVALTNIMGADATKDATESIIIAYTDDQIEGINNSVDQKIITPDLAIEQLMKIDIPDNENLALQVQSKRRSAINKHATALMTQFYDGTETVLSSLRGEEYNDVEFDQAMLSFPPSVRRALEQTVMGELESLGMQPNYKGKETTGEQMALNLISRMVHGRSANPKILDKFIEFFGDRHLTPKEAWDKGMEHLSKPGMEQAKQMFMTSFFGMVRQNMMEGNPMRWFESWFLGWDTDVDGGDWTEYDVSHWDLVTDQSYTPNDEALGALVDKRIKSFHKWKKKNPDFTREQYDAYIAKEFGGYALQKMRNVNSMTYFQ